MRPLAHTVKDETANKFGLPEYRPCTLNPRRTLDSKLLREYQTVLHPLAGVYWSSTEPRQGFHKWPESTCHADNGTDVGPRLSRCRWEHASGRIEIQGKFLAHDLIVRVTSPSKLVEVPMNCWIQLH